MTATAASTATAPEPSPPAVQVTYAGFWRRAAAFWLDVLLIGLVSSAITALVDNEERAGALALLFVMLYFVGLTWHFQGTLAKFMLGLRVVSRQGEPLGFWRVALREAIGRWVVLTVWAITVGLWLFGTAASSVPLIGAAVCVTGLILLSAWRKWMWHDLMASSVVVRERVLDAAPSWADNPPWLQPEHALSGPLISADDDPPLQPRTDMPPPTGQPVESADDDVVIPPADPGPFPVDDEPDTRPPSDT